MRPDSWKDNTLRGLTYAILLLVATTPVMAQNRTGIVDRVSELDKQLGRMEQQLGRMEQQLGRMEQLLKLSVQPWEPVAPDIRAFNKWVLDDQSRLRTFEFGIMRNRGFRQLIVSKWNPGLRFMTDFYWRGDHPTENAFGLGGSVWLVGTNDPREAKCKGNQALHHYFRFDNGKVELASGNGCKVEGPVYARRRIFKEDVK